MAKASFKQEAEDNLSVDESTVWRTIKLFELKGTVSKRPYPRRKQKKMTDTVKLLILNLIVDNPGIYLREVQDELYSLAGIDISITSICNFLKESGFTRQKMRKIARQRDYQLRNDFISDVSIYQRHMLVFVDETGTDRRDCLRKYAYSQRQ